MINRVFSSWLSFDQKNKNIYIVENQYFKCSRIGNSLTDLIWWVMNWVSYDVYDLMSSSWCCCEACSHLAMASKKRLSFETRFTKATGDGGVLRILRDLRLRMCHTCDCTFTVKRNQIDTYRLPTTTSQELYACVHWGAGSRHQFVIHCLHTPGTSPPFKEKVSRRWWSFGILLSTFR